MRRRAPRLASVFDTRAHLVGPRGILHLSTGSFLVANQNVGLSIPGEIDQFDSSGKFVGPLVPNTDPHAPFAPRGIILGPDGHTLYVADFGKSNVGHVDQYDVGTGKFLGRLNFDKWINSSASNGEFHPRGLVFGPDGRLYISLFSEKDFQHLGWVLAYNLKTGAISVFASFSPRAADCSQYLHRPEGLTFGPDGDLYVIGRQPDSSNNDTDKILVFGIGPAGSGVCRPWINLDQSGQPHTYARALVFGPGGHLILPMTVCIPGVPGPGTPACANTDFGAVRSYDVSANPATYTELVPPITDAVSCSGTGCGWWYLTFGNTDPVDLAYQGI
jgi:hypothetical protein